MYRNVGTDKEDFAMLKIHKNTRRILSALTIFWNDCNCQLHSLHALLGSPVIQMDQSVLIFATKKLFEERIDRVAY
jgi:hypothetical protein